MRIIEPSVTEFFDFNPQKHIERIGRLCYKSEDKITEDSNKTFISNLYKNKHLAMLEHFIFIYEVDKHTYELLRKYYNKFIYFSETIINNGLVSDGLYIRYIISFSVRPLMNYLPSDNFRIIESLIKRIIYDYNCPELFGNKFTGEYYENLTKIDNIDLNYLTDYEKYIHNWHSLKFVCDRGVSHELVRHRVMSFAQESTRYCNYSNDKFNSEITVIKPLFYDEYSENYKIWHNTCLYLEDSYFKLIENSSKPQEARSILPNSLKTEIVVTGRNCDWAHLFSLRTAPSAHPQMREVADIASKLFPTYHNKSYQIYINS